MNISTEEQSVPPTDLFSDHVTLDPYTYFGELRENDPVHWNEEYGVWIITRYEDVEWVAKKHEVFSSATYRHDVRPPYPPIRDKDLDLFELVQKRQAQQFIQHDRPEHTRMRRALIEYFAPRRAETFRPIVREAVASLLDEVQGHAELDFLRDVAMPLPVNVIASIMGIPADRRADIRTIAEKFLVINAKEDDRMGQLLEAMSEMNELVEPLIEQRRANPSEDVLSVLAAAEQDGVFTREQVLANASLLLIAGHETSTNMICNGLVALSRNPEQWERLAANPDGMAATATEEALRFDSPVKSLQRVALAEVRLRGRKIRAGDRLRWVIASANRDPRAFPNPDVFDIARKPNRHLSFGAGSHYCLGAPLARIEGQEMFRELARRFSSVELATEHLSYQPSIALRSLNALPVRLSPA